MDKDASYITEEKKKSLEVELLELKGPKRKEVLDALKYAKSLGDLSENAEYHQAREDQARLESRISEVEAILRNARVVEGGAKGDKVTIGSKVSVRKEGDAEDRNYEIVGSEESDMVAGKVSNTSPIGSALFGKKQGDAISVETPGGRVDYQITKVS